MTPYTLEVTTDAEHKALGMALVSLATLAVAALKERPKPSVKLPAGMPSLELLGEAALALRMRMPHQ